MLQVRDGRSHQRTPQRLHTPPSQFDVYMQITAQQAVSTAVDHGLLLQSHLCRWVSTAEHTLKVCELYSPLATAAAKASRERSPSPTA